MKLLATLDRKRWITATITLMLAFLSGYVMQHELNSAQSLLAAAAIEPPDEPFQTKNILLVNPPVYSSRVSETRVSRKGTCEPKAEMVAVATGMIRISFLAPCHVEKPLKFVLGDLEADVFTDARGAWSAHIPVLSEKISALFQFDDRTIKTALVFDQMDQYQHVLLAWNGSQTFNIHAEPLGEVGGSFVRIGAGIGASFEIFSFPSSSSREAGVVRLAVDAKVTAENCGRTAAVTAYQTGFSGGLRPTEISYTMPVCDRIGDTVRLQNLFRDMRLASR